MTLTFTASQIAERCTVTLVVTGAASRPSAIIIVDGKAYAAEEWILNLALERGPHTIYAQATDSVGTVTTVPIVYVMAYELVEYGIDVYAGDAKLDVIEPVLHDELFPVLPTLNFSCAVLLTGAIQAVIRERGIRQYQFMIATVAISGPLYVYTCLAAESYALTTAIMVLQTSYGSTENAIRLIAPSLNIINASFLAQTTYPQLFANIQPLEVVKQLLIQALAQASVRNGNLYAFPLDVSGKRVTFSADIKSAIAGHVDFYALGRYEINTGIGVSATTTYQRVTMTGYFSYNPKGYNGDVCSLIFYGVGVIPTVRNIEIDVDGVPVLIDATEFTWSPSVYCMKTITAIAQQNMTPLWYHDPDYHMQRLDPLTGWQRDADVYDAVAAHYIVKQYPTPDTVLTLHDAANWSGAVSDVTQVATTLLLPPSGALGMLKSVGNCSRAGLSAQFKNFDRIRFNWNPPDVGAIVTVSLQQDTLNKLELVHTFAGQSSSGFILNTGTASTDTLVKDITLSPIRQVKTVAGTTTAFCSYRVSLFGGAGELLWQDRWFNTINNTFEVNPPTTVSEEYQITTVRIEFKDLYLVDGVHYGVQVATCDITVQSYIAVGTHVSVVSSVTYSVAMNDTGNYFFMGAQWLPAATSSQWYEVSFLGGGPCDSLTLDSDRINALYYGGANYSGGTYHISVVATLRETVTDYAWVPSLFAWSSVFNLFEAVDIPLASMVRTGNPMNLATIVLTFTGGNYIDTLVMVADNPLPATVRAGTGSRAYSVVDDFGSEAGAQAYADGLLPVVSVAREQYTRDVSLATDLSVGDTVNGDGTNYTVYAVDYRADGKTVAAGMAMDILKTQLAEYARRIGTLERKV